jgi:RNA polymerase sigma factor (sigma-70 family)
MTCQGVIHAVATAKTELFEMLSLLKRRDAEDEQEGDVALPRHCQRWQHVGDEELMTRVQGGNQDCFEMLVLRHQKLLLCFAGRYLGSQALAQEVVQEVFLGLWRNRAQYQVRGKLRNYLITMTMNRCHDTTRKHLTQEKYSRDVEQESRDIPEGLGPPDQRLDRTETAAFVRLLLTRLAKGTKEVLILRYTQGFSLDEIAQITGMPLGTVKSHLSRGLKQLHQEARKDLS